MDAEGPEAFKECKRITEAIVEVGGNQDELVGESRVHVKVLRQRAAMAMATNPAAAEVAKEIRDRTQKILAQCPFLRTSEALRDDVAIT